MAPGLAVKGGIACELCVLGDDGANVYYRRSLQIVLDYR